MLSRAPHPRDAEAARDRGARPHRARVDAAGAWASSLRPRRSRTARRHTIGKLALFDSYHCSRYNTNTGVLTTDMFRAVFASVRAYLDA